MVDRRPPAPQPSSVAPSVLPPTPLVQLPAPLAQQFQPQKLPWSHFKPEEDGEAHLLRTNDWMEIHAFPEVVKVKRFCLTLEGEARLSYESYGHIAVDWNGQQNQFRQQYSK